MRVLSKVSEIYNEGTKLDWKNSNINKYIPHKYFKSSGGCSVDPSVSWYYGLYFSALLYYKSAELSEASYKNFKDYWEDFWVV